MPSKRKDSISRSERAKVPAGKGTRNRATSRKPQPDVQPEAVTWAGFEPEVVSIADLRPHPRNYRAHPADQIEHLVRSINEHGLYRNVVISRDGTILAGHGVVDAVRKIGHETIPVIRLDIDHDSTEALKVLTGDNEIDHLGEVDDRALTELLKDIKSADELLGTGYDEAMLASLCFVTRPASEVATIDEANEWAGMPECEDGDNKPKLHSKVVVNFQREGDRKEFARLLGVKVTGKTDTMWWPPIERNDLQSVRFE
jgi:hypothetical protein